MKPIVLNNLQCLVPLDHEVLSHCSCTKKKFDPRLKRSKWIELKLYKVIKQANIAVVPWPLIEYVKSYASPFLLEVKGSGFKTLPTEPPEMPFSFREMQMDAFKAIINKRCGNVDAPMGSGKAELILAVAQALLSLGPVFLTSSVDRTRKNLIERAEKYGLDKKYYTSLDKWDKKTPKIVVDSALKLNTRVESGEVDPNLFHALLTDESHHWCEVQWQRMFWNLPNITRCYGFSATSDIAPGVMVSNMNNDTASCLTYSGQIVYSLPVEEAKEYIDIPDILGIEYEWKDIPEDITQNTSYKIVQEYMHQDENRNRFIAGVAKAVASVKRRIVLIPVFSKSQGDHIAKLIGELAFSWYGNDVIRNIDGTKMSAKEAFESVKSRNKRVIIATGHLNEGWDLPDVDFVFNIEGRKRYIQVQRSGRSVRKSGVQPVVLNLLDRGHNVMRSQGLERMNIVAKYYNVKPKKVSAKELLEVIQTGN